MVPYLVVDEGLDVSDLPILGRVLDVVGTGNDLRREEIDLEIFEMLNNFFVNSDENNLMENGPLFARCLFIILLLLLLNIMERFCYRNNLSTTNYGTNNSRLFNIL